VFTRPREEPPGTDAGGLELCPLIGVVVDVENGAVAPPLDDRICSVCGWRGLSSGAGLSPQRGGPPELEAEYMGCLPLGGVVVVVDVGEVDVLLSLRN